MNSNKRFLKAIVENTMRYEDNDMIFIGSFNNVFIKYFGDIDVYSIIHRDKDYKKSYDNFLDIFGRIVKNTYTYLLEIKIETDDEKHKFYEISDFKESRYKILYDKIKMVKFDISIWDPYAIMFFSCDVVYKFDNTEKVNIKKALEEDIISLKREGEYYKILKRMYSIANVEGKKMLKIKLIDIFNSDIGLMMIYIKNRELLKIMKEKYGNDEITSERIKKNELLLKRYNFGKISKNYINKISEDLIKKL